MQNIKKYSIIYYSVLLNIETIDSNLVKGCNKNNEIIFIINKLIK